MYWLPYARTDPGGPFWTYDNPLLNSLPPWEHHLADLVNYSFRWVLTMHCDHILA